MLEICHSCSSTYSPSSWASDQSGVFHPCCSHRYFSLPPKWPWFPRQQSLLLDILLTRCHLIIWIIFPHNCSPAMWLSTCNFPHHYIPTPRSQFTDHQGLWVLWQPGRVNSASRWQFPLHKCRLYPLRSFFLDLIILIRHDMDRFFFFSMDTSSLDRKKAGEGKLTYSQSFNHTFIVWRRKKSSKMTKKHTKAWFFKGSPS